MQLKLFHIFSHIFIHVIFFSFILYRGRPILDIVTQVKPPQSELVIDPTRRGCDADPSSERPW